MSVEREVEFSKGKGQSTRWKASGLDEISLTIAPTVYPPREDSILLDLVLAELGFGHGRRLLEIGCGSGAISVSCSKRGWNVIACDVNPLAVATTKGNAIEQGCDIEVVEGGPGDIGAWMPSEGVDIIAWNLPYLDPTSGEKLGPLEDSALIENNGDLALLQALSENPELLNPNGLIFLVHSSNRLGTRIPLAWRRAGWATRNVERAAVGDEMLTVIACWKPFEESVTLHLDSCESTNDEILDKIDAKQGDLITSAHQNSGRGYRNRTWMSSSHNFMGSWSLNPKSIEYGPEFLQYAASLSVMDTISVFKNLGLPSHSWTHCSALEDLGIRVKWPNDIWLRTPSKIGKICGILTQGRTKGDETRVALGIGLNQIEVPDVEHSIGWDTLFEADLDDLIPVLHASIASTLEIHELIKPISFDTVLSSVFAAMRMTFCEGEPTSFGIDTKGGLYGKNQTVRVSENWSWIWR